MSTANRAVWGASLLTLGLLAAAAPARAEPAADPTSIWTLQDENSSITPEHVNDKYYVNGLRLAWTSPTGEVPHFLSGIGHSLWGEGLQRLTIDIAQQIYTPVDTSLAVPDPKDRPYAGVLMLGATLTQDTDDTRKALELQLGIAGPESGAEGLQNGFHGAIGDGNTNGWGSQIKDEPLLEITGQKIWRVPLGSVGGLETEALPQIEGGLGNLRVYGQTGSIFRIGQGLDADFGPSRVRPGLTGGDAYNSTRRFGWYFFAGANGEAVVHDVTIDGNDFRNSANASRMPFVGELEVGFAFLVSGVRISYTQVLQTEEIYGQHGGPHQFGSLTMSAHF